jgi:hypothetical protein
MDFHCNNRCRFVGEIFLRQSERLFNFQLGGNLKMGVKIIQPNLSDMQQNIQRNIAESQKKVLQVAECWNDTSVFDGRFIPILKPWNQYSINPNPDTVGPCSDLQLILPKPYRIFFISNRATGTGTNNIFIHLAPLGLSYSVGGTIAAPFPSGTENMFSLTGGERTDRNTPFLRLKNPVQQIFLTLDTGAGAQYDFTLCCTNEEDFPVNLGYLAP